MSATHAPKYIEPAPNATTTLTGTSNTAPTHLATKLAGTMIYAYLLTMIVSWSAWYGIPNLDERLPSRARHAWTKWFVRVPFYDAEPVEGALLKDTALLLCFAAMHSGLAMTSVKEAMGLPRSIERSVFCLQAAICLHAQMLSWRPFSGPTLWDVRGSTVGTALQVSWAVGFIFLLSATFAIDHFELFGLSQAYGKDINRILGMAPHPRVSMTSHVIKHGHYSLIAHPIMAGFLLSLFSAPVMSAPRLLLTVVLSTYVVVATVFFEEPRMRAELGAEYAGYLESVPRFFPFTKRMAVGLSLPPNELNTLKATKKANSD